MSNPILSPGQVAAPRHPVAGAERENTSHWFELSPTEFRIGIAAFCLALVARFHALLPGYSLDDYDALLLSSDTGWIRIQLLEQGRFFTYAIRAALTKLGAQPPDSAVLGYVLLTLVLIGAGIAICRLWGIQHSPAASALAVFFMVLHPYQAEIFTFRESTFVAAIAVGLGFLAITICTQSQLLWALSVLLLVAALLVYQIVLNYIAITLLFSVLFYICRDKDEHRTFWRQLGGQAGAAGVALAIYPVAMLVQAKLLHVPLGNRSALLSFNDAGARLHVAAQQLLNMFVSTEPVLPVDTKLLLASIPLIWFAFCMATPGGRPKWPRASWLAATSVASLPLLLGIALMLKEWWPEPRVLAHIAIFWAGVVSFCWIHSGTRVRRVLIGIAGVVMVSFIGINNQIFLDQFRLNMRDLAKANRIVMRLEALQDFAQLEGVIVDGGHWGYPFQFRTLQGDLNVSAQFAAWSKIPLLSEVSGYKFKPAPPTIAAAAQEYCKQSGAWPSASSVTSIQSFAVVCLGK